MAMAEPKTHRIGFRIRIIDICSTEIDQFYVKLFVDNQIFIFDILMSDTMTMQIVHCIDQLEFSKDNKRKTFVFILF